MNAPTTEAGRRLAIETSDDWALNDAIAEVEAESRAAERAAIRADLLREFNGAADYDRTVRAVITRILDAREPRP